MLGASHAVLLGACGLGTASTYVGRVVGYDPDWYLPLAETGGTTATAQTGASGTYQNSPQLGVDPIAQDDSAGKSVGLSGAATSPPHITASSPLSAASFTIHLLVQLDSITKSKHVLITTGGGPSLGDFSLEVLANGQMRAWSEDGIIREILGTAGDVSQGEAVSVVYQRQSNVAGWSQRLYVDGVLKAEDGVQRAWPSLPSQTWYIGAWSDLSDATDGLIAHVAGWNSLLTPIQISDLARANSVAWAEDIDAGAVQESTSKVVSVRQGGWHGKTPLVASAGDGSLVTTTESGEDITILAGGTSGDDETFSYSFTDANGKTSPSRTVTIDVTAAPAGLSIGALTAFQASRIQVTALPGWPGGRTPKEVVTQGMHAHGFVRRSWKPTDNDGSWMDFQAGWRKTAAADVIRIKLDDDSELDLICTVDHAIPPPGAGGTTRTLDQLGGADFTTWSAAIAALQTNDVLVVRAQAGGEVYPIDLNVGGPVSTVNGVKVVAHPDDLAAGRRPRIHVQGTAFARYADDLNNGHWEVHQNLGGAHGTIYRTTQELGSLVNIGCSYRTKSGRLRRCHTYTNTSGSPGALARLQDTSYPRIAINTPSGWDLYMGPGVYLHSDNRLYIRLTPLSDGIGATQTAGDGSNPPWNWSDDEPESEDPNQCQLYISSTDQQGNEGIWPTTGLSYCLRINQRSDWTLENLDFVGGGNTIEMNSGTGHTLRGCRILGWAPSNMEDEPSNQGIGRVHNMLEAEGTHGLEIDRCEFWGGAAPWFSWRENKGAFGAYSVAHKSNLFYMNDGTNDSFSARFLNTLMDGFASINIRGGKLRYCKFHQSTLAYAGMDGLMVCEPPSQTLEVIRTQIFEGTIGGWEGSSVFGDTMYVGYSLITNFRPICHDSGYWETGFVSQVNQFVPADLTIGHGSSPSPKECAKQYWYNNTSIGSHGHIRASVIEAGGGGMAHDGQGAGIFPYNENDNYTDWVGRNNIMAVLPNGNLGDSSGTRAPNWGDSHVSVVMHANNVGSSGGVLNEYSSDYNIYFRHPGMPTLPSPHFNGVITTLDGSSTERERSSLTDVQNDTGQEQNGRIADPSFVGAWDATKLDAELHANAFWCLQAGSPAVSGGDTTDRSWLDVDFGAIVSYGGQSWLGCMDPAASAVEQQVGPLGPMPSSL